MHIGHYFSVIKPAIEHGADVLIAEYHAPSSPPIDIDIMYNRIRSFGVGRDQVILQSRIFNAKLYFRLLSIARVGELERMTQYMAGDENDAHLLVYPVLMVHDVAGYDEVMVGEDQAQHLNYARDLLARYNTKFGTYYPNLPEARLVGGRVMSLTDPTKKMSKSDPKGCLFLDDAPEDIQAKIKAATMTQEGHDNLVKLYRDLGDGDVIPAQNSVFKPMVADLLIKVLTV